MIRLKLVGDTVQLFCDYEHRTLCQQVVGGKWDGKLSCWKYPIEALLCIEEVFRRQKVTAEKEVFDLLESLKTRSNILEQIRAGKMQLDEHPFLYDHQKMCKLIAKYFPRFAFFLDTGTGKTITLLEIIQDKAVKFLVVCPKAIIKSAWVEDAERFYPDMKVLPLSRNMSKEDYLALMSKWGIRAPYGAKTSKGQLKEILALHAQVYITNPDAFKSDVEYISSLGIMGLGIDESVTIKNPTSQITKATTKFADSMEYVYILSGKPAPNNEMDYFAQLRIIDTSLLGDSFYSFRQRYFIPTGYMGYDWKLKPGSETDIAKSISRKAIFIRKEDCLDLPEKTYIRKLIELPPDIYKQYISMEKAFMLTWDSNENPITAPNKAASWMKLRQITSGFAYNSETVVPIHNLKLQELKDTLIEIGDKPVLIWAQFKEEIRQIEDMLLKAGKSVVTAYSATKNLDDNIYAFKHGQAQYMVAHPGTLKYGVTFVNCSYAVYYSKSFDFNEYYQSHDRIYRNGQTVPCTFIDILAENTIDESIDAVVKTKGSTSLIIEDMVRRNGT